MKVFIGPYVEWVGPYQIAERLCKLVGITDEDKHDKFGDFLNETWILPAVTQWIYKKLGRKVKVRIDEYDTWNMDSTLAYIILPMLKQLKETKHGAPAVELEDVPSHLHSPIDQVDDLFFARWDWVIDEMIFAFESSNTNWEDQFYTTKQKLNMVGLNAYQARISNGYRLFGKYYLSLWD